MPLLLGVPHMMPEGATFLFAAEEADGFFPGSLLSDILDPMWSAFS